LDTNEEHIPSDVFAGRRGTSSWKGLIQHHQVGDFVNLRQKPVGERTTTGAGDLPAQQLNRAFKDAVVVWFCQAIFAVIAELDHASVLDGRPEQWMGLQHSSLF
jgi:hypothetical protein